MILRSCPDTVFHDGNRRIRKEEERFRADKLVSPTHQVGAYLPSLGKAMEWLNG